MPLQKPFILLVCLFLAAATTTCINENIASISDNVIVKQDISFPFGPTAVNLDQILVYASDIPGKYGFFYYNDRKIPLEFTEYQLFDYVRFDLGSHDTRISWIKSLSLRLGIKNNFPFSARIQFLTLGDSSNVPTDSIFFNGPEFIEASQTDFKIFDVPVEGSRLDHIKNAKFLMSRTWIPLVSSESSPLRLTSEDKIEIDLASRFHLEYNIKELKQ